MLELAKKITKTNKIVTLYQKWNDQVHKTEFCAPIVNMFMEHIGCDAILYHHQAEFDDDGKIWLYAIFAQIWPGSMTGGALWVCRTDDVECLSIKFASDDFQYKMISQDACYEKFFKWNFPNKIDEKEKITIAWDEIVDVSTGEERLRFLDK